MTYFHFWAEVMSARETITNQDLASWRKSLMVGPEIDPKHCVFNFKKNLQS